MDGVTNNNSDNTEINSGIEPQAAEEKTSETPEKKKRKTLKKVLLIILAVIILLLTAAGVYVFRLGKALSGIQPAQQPTEEPASSWVRSADETGSGTTDADITADAENESVDGTETTASPEPSGEASTREPAVSEDASDVSAGADITGQTTAHAQQPQETTVHTTAGAEQHTSGTPVTEAPTAPEPSTQSPEKEGNGYDLYRSGNFYAEGSMTDSSGKTAPMELAITPDSVYMVTDFEGIYIGMLYSGRKMYMVYPEKKIYMEINSALLKMMGVSAEELFDISSFGFDDMKPLSEAAEKTDAEVNGEKCVRYMFRRENGAVDYAFMNGTRLVRIQSLTTTGAIESQIDFTELLQNVPDSKKQIPSDYKKKGLLDFLEIIGGMVS